MTRAMSVKNLPNDARRDAWRVLLPAGEERPNAEPAACCTRRFAVLPRRDRARWYIPVDSRHYAAGAAALYQPYRRSARVAASVLRSAARAGALRWYPSSLEIEAPRAPALETLVCRLAGCPEVRLAIYSGRGGRKRSTVLVAAISPRGALEAFARIALAPEGDQRVRREAEMLGALNALQSPAPQLLWSGDVDGRRGLLQRAVKGAPSPAEWTPAHDEFLLRLLHGKPRPMSESALITRVRSESRADERLRAFSGLLERSIATLGEPASLPVVYHGDFAPWNIIAGDGGLTAIDWESAELDGLPHLDRLYFAIATGVLLDGWSADRLSGYLEAWPRDGRAELPEHQAKALLTVLIFERLLRWREDGLGDRHVLVQGCEQTLRRLDAGKGNGL
jgi:Phosphotransferase enzyme family